jgi:outer membrane protein insertion porin family
LLRLIWPSILCFILIAAASAAEPKSKPVKIEISGYGILGNRLLKRLVRTMQEEDMRKESVDANFVENAGLIILSRMREDGFLKPTVVADMILTDDRRFAMRWHETVDPPLPRPLAAQRVHFKVFEGRRYYFDELTFTGLEVLPEKQARSFFIETDALLPLKANRIFTPGRLKRGMATLTELLERSGFQEARVQGDDVRRNDGTGAVKVRIDVDQGPLHWVRSVRVETFVLETNQPIYVETLRPKHPFSQVWLQDMIQTLRATNYVGGYADTGVEVKNVGRELITNAIHLDFLATVRTGPQIDVGRVRFMGHKHTRKGIMADRVPLEAGDLLNPALAEKGRSRLARLGIFDSVKLRYDIIDEDTRDVIYDVKEGKSLNVNVLFGYGSYELVRGGVELETKNVWGRAHHARLRAIQSFKSTRGDFLYTMPQFIGEEIDLFLNGFGLVREEIDFIRKEYGGGAGGLKHFPGISSDLSLRYNYQVLRATDAPEAIARRSVENPGVGAMIMDLRHDMRDSPIYPTRGYKLFTTLEVASEYLAGDVDYQRFELAASFHQPVGGGRLISLGLSHGLIAPVGPATEDIPFNKRFFPGGEYSIRGYQDGEAAPRNAQGDIIGAETYLFGTIEFEQALTPKWALVFFADSVAFARDFSKYPADEALYSVGAGLRWKSIVGPVRLEYGHNLNPRERDPIGTLHFSLGFPF